MIYCQHCEKLFKPIRKTQRYCSEPACQRKRKSVWQIQKLSDDSDYRHAQNEAQQRWRQKHPNYWKEYRKRNLSYTCKNRALQRERNKQRRSHGPLAKAKIAKMDARGSLLSGTYCIIPFNMDYQELIAKMDVRPEVFTIQPVSGNVNNCKERTYNDSG